MTESFGYISGYDQGWSDGTHPSGVVTHASHRDPEGWAEAGDDYQRGYQLGWDAAR
jgi:hypothetical protein